MRVLFYVGARDWSATSRAVLAAARGLASRSHTITVACCGGTRLEALAQEAGLETVAIGGTWFGSGGAWDLRKVVQSRFVEVAVVTTDSDHRIVASAMRVAERGGVLRRVPSFDGFDPAQGGRLSLKMAPSGMIVSSASEVTEPHPSGWVIPTTVAPLGVTVASYEKVEPATRAELGAPSQGLLVAVAYDPTGRNRMAAVFRSLALLAPRHSGLHAVVFGPESSDDALRMHASALGVGRCMSFLGDAHDVRSVMRAADAGWVVSSGDAGAFACLDFMALRVPVIMERCPLAGHYVVDGTTGVAFPPDEPASTASVAASVLTAADVRAAMANAALARVQRDFPESAMIDGFERAVHVAGDRTKWQTS